MGAWLRWRKVKVAAMLAKRVVSVSAVVAFVLVGGGIFHFFFAAHLAQTHIRVPKTKRRRRPTIGDSRPQAEQAKVLSCMVFLHGRGWLRRMAFAQRLLLGAGLNSPDRFCCPAAKA